MNNPIIQVKNLSKLYHIGLREKANRTIREAVTDSISTPLRNFNRLRKLNKFNASQNNQPNQQDTDTIWALKDISFEMQPGEVLGIIGRNGAGKSTLLKILSRITEPTFGEIRLHGRVASLLEVGTGFHPELTGRENIYLNGTILGMRRSEIDLKFDEIVAFSEIEKFLDTPVKRYSSGMYVRLAFAVAAHLEPEILLIDEVLAVGDAEFQKKCLGKVGHITGEGRTVLFVSHNMAAISHICGRCIVLDKGLVCFYGSAQDAIDYYIDNPAEDTISESPGVFDLTKRKNPYNNDLLIIQKLRLLNSNNVHQNIFQMGELMTIVVDVEGLSDQRDTSIGIIFKSRDDQRLAGISDGMSCSHVDQPRERKEQAVLTIQNVPFTPGSYWIAISIARKGSGRVDYIDQAASFSVVDSDIYGTGYQVTANNGIVYLNGNWKIFGFSS